MYEENCREKFIIEFLFGKLIVRVIEETAEELTCNYNHEVVILCKYPYFLMIKHQAC